MPDDRELLPRVVSLLPAATEMLMMIGARVVGVSHECNWPVEAASLPSLTRSRIDSTLSSEAIDQQVKRLLAEGGSLYEIDGALLESLSPSVVVTQSKCDVCALPEEAVHAAVADAHGLSATRVVTLNPATLGEVLADVERLGQAAGVAEAATHIRAKLQARVDCLANGERLSQLPSVVVVEWLEPPMVASNWTPEIVRLAGGRCPLAIAGQPSQYATWEQIAEAEPDLLILAPCGFNLDRTLSEWRRLPKPAVWGQIRAVRSGNVFAVDGDSYFNRPGPRLVDSAELAAALLRGNGDLDAWSGWARLG